LRLGNFDLLGFYTKREKDRECKRDPVKILRYVKKKKKKNPTRVIFWFQPICFLKRVGLIFFSFTLGPVMHTDTKKTVKNIYIYIYSGGTKGRPGPCKTFFFFF
jgi:hypothetical protein